MRFAGKNIHLNNYYSRNSFAELLNTKICNLNLSIKGTYLENIINTVLAELKNRGIPLKPHFWLSDEWFCPDGIVGVAIPFYLAHPQLLKLEKEQIGYAEGEGREWALKILRHEIGHVVDNAFCLRRKRNRQKVFGKCSESYPEYYTYQPYSKNFVKHIEDGYAQSHPSEDFAETFAVWLDPKSDWKNKYKGWGALKKLNYINDLMMNLKNERPRINNRLELDPIRTINRTLKSHYSHKRKKLGLDADRFWDFGLKKFFSNSKSKNSPSAALFLRKNRSSILRHVTLNTGFPKYRIREIYDSMLIRSKELDLRLVQKEMATRGDLSYYLTRKAKSFVSQGRHLIAL